jgi:hypothetical protein
VALAARWPGIAASRHLRVEGPRAEALLLRGWLGARLGHPFELDHVAGTGLRRVAIDDVEVEPARDGNPSPADLLSAQLEIFARDPVYEAAVRAAVPRAG